MRTITLEEHFASPGFLDGPGSELKEQASKFGAAAAKLFERLSDVGEKRIAEMDEAKIDMQVLSLTSPGTEQLEAAEAMLDVMPTGMTKLNRPISAYLRENVHYTFSGFNFTPTFLDLLLQVGVDRIMFSADHPYGSMAAARAFLDQLPVSSSDRERIAHGNAERLFGLPA
jgi:predicted TIM-barrel fold metal-dependent hydrolase